MKPPYCNACGLPHHGECLRKPVTLPERLDAAENGQQFAEVLGGLFNALEQAMDEEMPND